jgi:hypothetical protein
MGFSCLNNGLFHAFQLDILHLSFLDRYFLLTDFQFHILFFQICSTQGTYSQAWDFPPHSSLAQQTIGLPYGLKILPYPRLFLPTIHSSAKQIFSSHAHYIFITYLQWLTNNFRIVHTNNQIHFLKKEIPFLAVWLNRKLVFLMGLQHCHIQDPFPPTIHSLHSQTNC